MCVEVYKGRKRTADRCLEKRDPFRKPLNGFETVTEVPGMVRTTGWTRNCRVSVRRAYFRAR
jgi:hypothetical protein